MQLCVKMLSKCHDKETMMSTPPARSGPFGLAIVGAGRVGLIRGEIAAQSPHVGWIGIAETNPQRAAEVAEKLGADFVTDDYRELLARPEVNAAIISTEGHLHFDPVMAALENANKVALLIEKPLANNLGDSATALAAIEETGVDAVIGYTQRFRRRWLVAKDRIASGQLGDVTTISTRAYINRLLAINNYKRDSDPSMNTPMVITGTHVLDLVMWMKEGAHPVEVYARSVDATLGSDWKGIDGTVGTVVFSDGSVYNSTLNWALPVSWPAATYSLEVGIVGTDGVITVDDTHRDFVLAVSSPSSFGYVADDSRRVDFVGSAPPGDMALGALRGPMRDETEAWLYRVASGTPTLHATAREGHDRLVLAKAFDLSSRRRAPVTLPLDNDLLDGQL